MAHYTDLESGDPGVDYAGYREAFAPLPSGLYRRYFKRGLDGLSVLLAIPIVLPLVLILGLMIRLDGGPVFFCQNRIGRHGRVFRLWKLRSMQVDAERRLEEHLAADPAARAEWDETQKLKVDPRITPLGRLLRKTSLDELPQLWNVLRGDMSLVGPRPMLPAPGAALPGNRAARLLQPAARPDRLLADQRPERGLLRRARRARRALRPADVAPDRPPGPRRHGPGGAARHRLLRPGGYRFTAGRFRAAARHPIW